VYVRTYILRTYILTYIHTHTHMYIQKVTRDKRRRSTTRQNIQFHLFTHPHGGVSTTSVDAASFMFLPSAVLQVADAGEVCSAIAGVDGVPMMAWS
jgi:hypothetical protein